MRMTDEQIRHVVNMLRMTESERAALLRQAINAHDPSARFVVYAKGLQMGLIRDER